MIRYLMRRRRMNDREPVVLARIPGPGEWSCHHCGDIRPDALISVQHVPVPGMEDLFPGTRQNFRYCNDRTECIEASYKGFIKT